MLSELVEWLKNIAVFMILCETMLSFSPTKTYKKYIKPFVGLILLLRISVFLVGAVEIDWNNRVNEVFEHYEQSVSRYLEVIPIIENDEAINKDITDVLEIKIEDIKVGAEE